MLLDIPCVVQLGDETTVTTNHYVQLPIEIHHDTYLTNLLVVDKLPYDSVLGLDFVLKFDDLIRPTKKTISLDPDYDLFDPHH
ncbi:hypothetical protein BpHYR1_052454 [Brachionus plicatilis]|uniref:Uncharacterized protein n=1 Tax=Brachionus plicatilis TaxID=10195 RepID=A0A3M7QY68_BRAPC|nr:hypothetical protein BpHYR1_052454 [Brachionus plicatilis]